MLQIEIINNKTILSVEKSGGVFYRMPPRKISQFLHAKDFDSG